MVITRLKRDIDEIKGQLCCPRDPDKKPLETVSDLVGLVNDKRELMAKLGRDLTKKEVEELLDQYYSSNTLKQLCRSIMMEGLSPSIFCHTD